MLGLLIVFLLCAALGGFGVWYWWSRGAGLPFGADQAPVGECFPAATDGPLDTSHGTVSCLHPNAIWKVMKVMDGEHNGDVIGTCGPEADALIYVEQENRSYCLDYIN